MANDPKKKSFLDKAIDALTNRDEKAAAEAAAKKQAEFTEIARRKQEEAMKAKAEAEKAATLKAQADAEAAKKAVEERAEKAREEAIMRAKAAADNAAMIAAVEAAAEKKRQEAEAAKAAATVKHVWTSEDTYASLALKHYGKFTEPYWRLIYDHNKEIIGNHPNAIRVGLEIEIPPLPEELK